MPKEKMNLLKNPQYDPDHLIDTLLEQECLKNDTALASRLSLSPQIVSKIRHRRSPVTARVMIAIHELDTVKFPISRIRDLMGGIETS